MKNKVVVELDNEGRPLVYPFDEFAGSLLKHALVLLFYLMPLNLGLRFHDFFTQSPLVNFCGMVFGFLSSVLSWILAYLVVGILAGNFYFAKIVFSLFLEDGFRTAIALVFLFLPLARFMVRTIDRTTSSYVTRKWVFCIAGLLMIVNSISIFECLKPQKNNSAYVFSFVITGIAYFTVAGIARSKEKIEKNQETG